MCKFTSFLTIFDKTYRALQTVFRHTRVQTPSGPVDRAIRPMGRVGLLVSPLNKVIFRRVRIAAIATTAQKELERWRSAVQVWQNSLVLSIRIS